MSNRITIIGSTNVDFITKLPRLPQRGESVTGGTFMQAFGGKGANQAVAVARTRGSDIDVSFVSCLGGDMFAPALIEGFRRDGIDTSRIMVRANVSTGTALIMLGGEGENYLAVAPGANFGFDSAMTDACEDVVRSSQLLVLQMEINVDATQRLLQIASRHNVPVMLNFAPVQTEGFQVTSAIHCLVANEVEAEALSGIKVDSPAAARTAAEVLLEKGPQMVCITLGPQGAFIAMRDRLRELVPTYTVKPVDTTAAGDTFCGALAVALVEGRPLLEAVRFANAAAAISVTRMGAQPSIPWRAEVEQFLTQ